jgi:hypothetical protein
MSTPWNYAAALNAQRQAARRFNNARRASLQAWGTAYGPHTGTRSGAFYASPQGQNARHQYAMSVVPVARARHNVRNRSVNVNTIRRGLLQWAHWPNPQTRAQAVAAANQILNMARSGNAAAVNALYRALPQNLVREIMQYVRQ